jgi:hypothetical protein
MGLGGPKSKQHGSCSCVSFCNLSFCALFETIEMSISRNQLGPKQDHLVDFELTEPPTNSTFIARTLLANMY